MEGLKEDANIQKQHSFCGREPGVCWGIRCLHVGSDTQSGVVERMMKFSHLGSNLSVTVETD